jgi:tetratricopeptide (TPR) repeat protein
VALLAEAQTRQRQSPDDLDALIWVGRRTAYLGRYREAIALYTDGLARHPGEPRLLRHRGHRYLTVRELALAEADLALAAEGITGKPDEIEADGLPNARNTPTSTLHSNIWYHLGLARYLRGNFEGALAAYRSGLALPGHVDNDIATRYWLVLTLRRLGRDASAELAAVNPKADVIESGDYLRLLLLFRDGAAGAGEALLQEAGAAESDLSFPTVGYGVGVWHLVRGDEARAKATFQRVVDEGPWAAFGALAAEAELARLRRPGAGPPSR